MQPMTTIRVGSGMTKVELEDSDGNLVESFELDVLKVWREVDAHRARAAEDPKADQYSYLDLFKQRVKEAGGPELTDSAADETFDNLAADYSQKKSARLMSLPSAPTSPSSMDLTQLDSVLGNLRDLKATSPGSKPGADFALSGSTRGN